MRRRKEAVKTDVRKRMSSLHRQSVARNSEELGTHLLTLCNWIVLASAGKGDARIRRGIRRLERYRPVHGGSRGPPGSTTTSSAPTAGNGSSSLSR
jgi:hypothetical protein